MHWHLPQLSAVQSGDELTQYDPLGHPGGPDSLTPMEGGRREKEEGGWRKRRKEGGGREGGEREGGEREGRQRTITMTHKTPYDYSHTPSPVAGVGRTL